ncbi:MAG: cell division protein FtsW [Chloroflexi bacterium]|nr:cell division protein FtsW [Chloroflexota bacterium]
MPSRLPFGIRLNFDRWLLIFVFALIAIGVPTVYSSSHQWAYSAYDDAMFFLKRQMMWAVIGTVGMLMASQFPYAKLQRLSVPLALGIMFILLLVLVFGALTNGARRWLTDNASIQPSEWAKLIVIIYVSHWLTKRHSRLNTIVDGFIPFLFIIGVSAGLIALQPDLSTSIVIVTTAMGMFFIAGAPLSQFGTLGGIMAALVFALLVSEPWRVARFMRFLEPLKDRTGDGYQIYQMLIALSNGGLTGNGFGTLSKTVEYLPASHTDAIFAVIGNDFGFVGCAVIVVLFAFLTWRCMTIALNAPDLFGRLLGMGIALWIGVQALLNIASATSTVPFTGIPLPFISLGGSALVAEMTGIGILLNIALSAPRVHQPNARMAASVGRPAAPAHAE